MLHSPPLCALAPQRRYGWRYEIRPGAKEMFKALLDAGAMATLWSEASGAVSSVGCEA
jgi:hypothetical protein